jgi:outer membrane protein assembly factor BamB
MFHVKHRPSHLVLLLLGALLLLGTACTKTAKPQGWAAPVDAGDGVVVMHNSTGSISAVRVTDAGSTVLWTFPAKGDDHDYKAFYATPIVDRDVQPARVLLASYSGQIASLDLATGAPTPGWPAEVRVKGHIVATPVLDGATLYVADGLGAVHSVNLTSGVVSNTIFKSSDRIWGGPAFSSGTLYVGSLDGTIDAIAPDGSRRWSKDVGGGIAGDVTVEGDTVYVGTLESRFIAVDAATGNERWHFDGSDWFWAKPLITNDTLYLATTEGRVYALDRATGQERWHSNTTESDVHTSPVIVGGALVIADRHGWVYGLDPNNGTELWRQQQPGKSFFADPLVAASGIFYASSDGTLVRVRPQEQGALSVVYQRG